MSAKTQSTTTEKVLEREAVEPPRDYKVIYLNDDYTPMDFVVGSLIEIFNHDPQAAQDLTFEIHNSGSAVVAVLPYEIAEHKGVEVTLSARAQNYPLEVKLEEE